jgi:Cu/Ag efflux protein CusF
MRCLSILAIAVSAAFPPLASAQKPEGGGVIATAPGKGLAMQAVKATATVKAVDKATRSVTLEMPRGGTRTVVASEEVRNFDQIKVGDKLVVKYMESLAIELKKDGKEVLGRKHVSSMERSEPGQKPGGMAAHEITAVADVVKVDAAKKVVTVKNDKGEMIDLNIKDPEQLKLIKKGDQIQATYTEAMAISLEPAPAAAPAPAKKK